MSTDAAKTLSLAEGSNIANVADLQVALANLLEADDAQVVDVDCSAVRSIDCAVLQCLLGKALRCVRPSEDFTRIAAYVGLEGALVNT